MFISVCILAFEDLTLSKMIILTYFFCQIKYKYFKMPIVCTHNTYIQFIFIDSLTTYKNYIYATISSPSIYYSLHS